MLLVLSNGSKIIIDTSPIIGGTINAGLFVNPDNTIGNSDHFLYVEATNTLFLQAQGPLDTNIVQQWRNNTDTIDMFAIRGDGSMSIYNSGTFISESTTNSIVQTFDTSGTNWNLYVADSASSSSGNIYINGNATPQFFINLNDGLDTGSITLIPSNFTVVTSASSGGISSTLDLNVGTYNLAFTDPGVSAFSNLMNTATLLMDWSIFDNLSNGTQMQVAGGNVLPYWQAVVYDGINNNFISCYTTFTEFGNPIQVTTGDIILPAGNLNAFDIWSRDISAGNAAFHTRAEGGEIYYMGSKFGLLSNHPLTFYTNNILGGSFGTDQNFTLQQGLLFSTKGINTTAGDSATINSPIGRFRKDTTGTTFVLTNSFITANSIMSFNIVTTGITSGYDIAYTCGAGTVTITFQTAGVALAPNTNCDIDFIVLN